MSTITDQEWSDFKEKFSKNYEDETEDNMRRGLYEKAKLKIEDHNKKFAAGEVTWKMGINHLADLTETEMSMRYGARKPPQ